MRRIVILGAGGQARELRWALEACNAIRLEYEFIGFVVTDLSRLGDHDSRECILGDYEWLRTNRSRFDALALGIGTPSARIRVATDLEAEFGPEYWPSIIHPSAIYDARSTSIESGVFLSAGVVATVNVHFHAHALANFGCTIGHDAVIGRGCVVNPGANISGGVVLEEGVQVGTGAQVLQYLRIGRAASIGAGAVVTKDIPPGLTVVGVPARALDREAKNEADTALGAAHGRQGGGLRP